MSAILRTFPQQAATEALSRRTDSVPQECHVTYSRSRYGDVPGLTMLYEADYLVSWARLNL